MSDVLVFGFDPSLTSYGVASPTTTARFTTKPGPTRMERVQRIVDGLQAFVSAVYDDQLRHSVTTSAIVFVVEASIYGMAGAAHDAGYLRAHFDLLAQKWGATVYEIAPTTLKKFGAGSGATKSPDMPLEVYLRWGVRFDDDPGRDKLHAFLAQKYGEAIVAGEVTPKPPRPRGRGGRSEAGERKRARTRTTIATP